MNTPNYILPSGGDVDSLITCRLLKSFCWRDSQIAALLENKHDTESVCAILSTNAIRVRRVMRELSEIATHGQLVAQYG